MSISAILSCADGATYRHHAPNNESERPISRRYLAPFLIPMLGGCSGSQSALDPAGVEADAVYTLFIVMVAGGGLIWLAVVGLLIYAGQKRAVPFSEKEAGRLIVWGGVVFPIFVLLMLLSYAVWLMPQVRPWFSSLKDGQPRIEVTGQQFWWRIRYLGPGGQTLFETANELRLPVNERSVFALKAMDVIHSFWIPALGGKMDMIPGRANILSLQPTRAGLYRGPCAEFCGTSHALMAFSVVVMERPDYDAWMARQIAGNASVVLDGKALFFKHGCSACHAITGTQARGRIGPDLTFLGARQTIGAGALPNTADSIARFIRDPAAIKPGAEMPAFGMLPHEDIKAIAAYLGALK